MKTPWNPDHPIPLPEYSRPQLKRKQWMNLNGEWDYAIRAQTLSQPQQYDGKILVPYPVESLLSGVQQPLNPDETLWYRRFFHIPPEWMNQRLLLHFGAVDFACTLRINNQKIGDHQGGYLPFTFNITEALKPGENEILLAVTDPTDDGMQERGKQVLNPKGIWYTAVSGIWQTVSLEPVPDVFIHSLKLTPDIDQSLVIIQVNTSLCPATDTYHCEVDIRSADSY